MKDSSATVNAQNAEIACEPGSEYKIVDGNESTSERTKCCKRNIYSNLRLDNHPAFKLIQWTCDVF